MDGFEATDEILDVLGDPESRRLLVALRGTPMSAKELGAVVDLSLPTVYRRLDRLSQHGLVDSTTEVRANGTHFKQYVCTLEQTTVSLTEEGFRVGVTLDDGAASARPEPETESD